MRRFPLPPDWHGGPEVVLAPRDAHHIRHVLRLKSGDPVILFDGRDTAYHAELSRIDSETVSARMTGKADTPPTRDTEITLALGFLKEKKMDSLIRPLTELGVTRLIPVISARTVARPAPDRFTERKRRWEKIARESLKQCRRNHDLEIDAPIAIDDLMKQASAWPLKLIFWEETTAPAPYPHPPEGEERKILALIGPEGGFTPAEAQHAEAAGFHIAGLGPRILKAETAAIAVATLMQYQYGDMRKKIP